MKRTVRTWTSAGKSSTPSSSQLILSSRSPSVRLAAGAYPYFIDPYKQSALIRDFNELYSKIYDKEKLINL